MTGAAGAVAQASGQGVIPGHSAGEAGHRRARRQRPGSRAGRAVFHAHRVLCRGPLSLPGAVALMLEWLVYIREVPGVDFLSVKEPAHHRRVAAPDDGEYPNREWGYGQLDLYNTFETMRQL